jgi:hypothetical protein
MSEFLLSNKIDKDSNIIDVYNKWSFYSGIIIEDTDIIEWSIKNLSDMMGINSDLIEDAIKIKHQKEI